MKVFASIPPIYRTLLFDRKKNTSARPVLLSHSTYVCQLSRHGSPPQIGALGVLRAPGRPATASRRQSCILLAGCAAVIWRSCCRARTCAACDRSWSAVARHESFLLDGQDASARAKMLSHGAPERDDAR
jgi:hypothetical protein